MPRMAPRALPDSPADDAVLMWTAGCASEGAGAAAGSSGGVPTSREGSGGCSYTTNCSVQLHYFLCGVRSGGFRG